MVALLLQQSIQDYGKHLEKAGSLFKGAASLDKSFARRLSQQSSIRAVDAQEHRIEVVVGNRLAAALQVCSES